MLLSISTTSIVTISAHHSTSRQLENRAAAPLSGAQCISCYNLTFSVTWNVLEYVWFSVLFPIQYPWCFQLHSFTSEIHHHNFNINSRTYFEIITLHSYFLWATFYLLFFIMQIIISFNYFFQKISLKIFLSERKIKSLKLA